METFRKLKRAFFYVTLLILLISFYPLPCHAAPAPLHFINLTDKVAVVGQSIRFTTQAISIDGVYATNYSVSGLPSTAQYSTDVDGNGKTLVSVQWFKPWYGEEKTYPVTFTAYNNVTGASVSQKIYLSVMTPTQPVQTVVTGSMLRNPMLYDRFIVYEDASSGFNKICLYDTLYPSIIDIASSNTYTSPFMVGMDAVYWQDTRTNPASVMKYDISTGALTTVTQGAPAYSGGASYDNATVSVTSNNSGTLTGLKISYDDGLFYTILQNALVSPHPSIYKDRVAYIGRTAQGQMALCLIDLNYTPTITSVEPAGPGNGGLIVINGKHLFGPASGAIWLKSGSVLFTPSVVRAGGDIQQAFFDYDRDIYDPSNLYPPVATYTVTIGNSNADNSVVAHLGKRALTPFISLDTSRWCTNGASLVLTPLSPYSMKIDIALGPVVNSQLIYEIYRCESTNSLYPTPSNLRWTLIKAQDAATYIDTSLQPGTSYSYQVIELLSMVRSYVTTESTLYLPDPANIPMAPSNLYLTGTSTNQIDMTWHDNSNNEAGFRLERSPDGTTGWTQIATPLNNSTSYSDSGLSDGTNYYYRIRATNTAGDSPFSNITMTGTDRINPSNLTALPMEGGNRVVLQWTSALNNRAGFNIYRWTGFAWGTPIASTPATVKTYTDSGLTANTKYYYKVASTNDNRDAKPAPEAMVTTTPANSTQAPVAPSNLIATPASSSQINLSWSDLSNNETGFKIKRKTGAGDFTLFTTASLNSGSYSDTGLVAGTTYAYQVCATNAMGDSGWITSASVTTPQNTQQLTITATAGANGTISPAGTTTVNYGTNRSYTITPNTGYRLASLKIDGVAVSQSSTYTFTTVTVPHTIEATFAAITYTITATAGANGTISPGTATVSSGANQAFTITPATGYVIQDVKIDGSSVGAVASYTFSNITAIHTISATFANSTNTITSTASVNGTISPAGTTTVNYGANRSYTITPNTGYYLANLKVDGVTTAQALTYTFTNVTAPHAIEATFAVITYTITGTPGANGTISPSTATVNSGSNQTFTITPATGYAIQDVRVDSVSVGTPASYTFSNVTGNHAITATFIRTYTITATAGAHGTISPATATVNSRSSQTFTITPESGYHIESVKLDGGFAASSSPYILNCITADHAITVTFSNTYNIMASLLSPNGSISPSGTTAVPCGTNQTYTMTPNPGYYLAGLTIDGFGSTNPISPYTFTNVNAGHSIGAFFSLNPTVTATTDPTMGTISPNGTTTVPYGTNQTYTITPAPGYAVYDVKIDGQSYGPIKTYTFNNVKTSHAITATFVVQIFTINASAGAHGTITPSGTQTLRYGATQQYWMTPATGYHIESFVVDGTTITDPAVLSYSYYTFSNITASHTISVTFAPTMYALTINASNGTVTKNPSSATYISGGVVTLTANPAAGYAFSSWSGDLSGTNSPAAIMMDANKTVTANFTPRTYTLTVGASPSAGGGVTRTPDKQFYNYGDIVTLTATPTAAYSFTSWSGVASATNTATITINDNKTVTANFTPKTYVISVLQGANGSIKPGTMTFNYGASQNYTITPNAGYGIASVVVDGTAVANAPSNYFFATIAAAHSITATFKSSGLAVFLTDAVANNENSVTVSWVVTDPATGALTANYNRIDIYRQDGGSGTYQCIGSIIGNAQHIKSFTDTFDLPRYPTHSYQVIAVGPNGSSPASSPMSVSTSLPAPESFKFSALTSTSATLCWKNPANIGDGYREIQVFRNGTLFRRLAGTSTSFIDSGLTPGKSYTYCIRGVKSNMWGDYYSAYTATIIK